MLIGRFAPSPTGDLHVGNLRTALVAWLAARSVGGLFLMRMEDLDHEQSSPATATRQLADLERLGLDWDGDVVFQSNRFDRYDAVIADLADRDLLYPCYCTRKEITEAASAPHDSADPHASAEDDAHRGPDVAERRSDVHQPVRSYPGTCRHLTSADRRERERRGRPPALRLRGPAQAVSFDDAVYGPRRGLVDDVVVRRNDGVAAYNLAVVVDDSDSGVTQVVRGDDLLGSVPRQLHIASTAGLRAPRYAHVPLVMAPNGERLAKRHGAVTLREREAAGDSPASLVGVLAHSIGLVGEADPIAAAELVDAFSFAALHTERWTIPGEWAAPDQQRR